jgi:hypothetical protein
MKPGRVIAIKGPNDSIQVPGRRRWRLRGHELDRRRPANIGGRPMIVDRDRDTHAEPNNEQNSNRNKRPPHPTGSSKPDNNQPQDTRTRASNNAACDFSVPSRAPSA